MKSVIAKQVKSIFFFQLVVATYSWRRPTHDDAVFSAKSIISFRWEGRRKSRLVQKKLYPKICFIQTKLHPELHRVEIAVWSYTDSKEDYIHQSESGWQDYNKRHQWTKLFHWCWFFFIASKAAMPAHKFSPWSHGLITADFRTEDKGREAVSDKKMILNLVSTRGYNHQDLSLCPDLRSLLTTALVLILKNMQVMSSSSNLFQCVWL